MRNVKRWQDGSTKKRWVSVPFLKSATYPLGAFANPAGPSRHGVRALQPRFQIEGGEIAGLDV